MLAQNFSVPKNADIDVGFTITGVNITGYGLAFYSIHTDGTRITKTSALAQITLDTPASGIGTIILLPADLALVGEYKFALRRIDSGSKDALSEGVMTVRDTPDAP